jgi:two-component system, OmpR family, response regulator
VRIHVIEGNHNLRSLLAWHLQQVGYQVQQSPTLEHAYQRCEAGLPTLAILDSDLPDGEGVEFCRWLYPQNTSLILMLSARIREIDVVTALEAGVDDYLKKPFGMPEFLARVAALLRRNRLATNIPTDMTYGDLRIDLVRRCIYIKDKSIDLSPQEFSLIYVLAQANGQPVHRRELLKRAWDIDVDNPRTVDSHILSLRKKFGQPESNGLPSPPIIETIRKVGYRLNY